ncbi:hypothetical protein BDZ89DRAFT_1076136 [Hymenopellis radicata]|nr:hypothetical protein BDZ89DRAFT_1076136 [Hymenopellis radicata]
MALTQTATIPGPGPSWDEEVVPALRKRLQSESRTIARRISAISVTSADDAVNTTFASDYSYRDHISAANSYQGPQPPARPRPSLQQTRTGSDNGPSRVNPTKSPSTRAVARAVSPRQEPRPTRIPKPARSRAGSTSSHNYSLNGSAASPYSSPKSPQPDPELFILHEKPGAASRSTISVNSRQDSGLLHEPPPFRAGSATSSNDHSSDNNRRVMDLDPPRPSIDSEERPYEHWYRGDISRNGGVGELRVAKRQEMLEIANYGHSLRANQGPRNALTDALEEGRRRRRRADSVGPTNRQSFYMEDDGFVQVKDESPLTDLEGSDPEHTSDYHTPPHSYHEENSSASTPGLAMYDARSMTPTLQQRPSSRQQQQSRIPTPTREPPRTATPNQMSRGASEPPSLPSTSPSLPSTSTPKSTAKRAASPQTSSATKKSRTQAAKATRAKTEAAKKERDEIANRRSVAHYPTPGDDMRDAIPSWTQPVPRQGNWDDVVLPVVARKKGLDGHYEQADGSPRARQVESIIAPAPGTFGYDHSKYRRPPRDDDSSSIPMDEFGLRQENGGIVEEEEDVQPRHAPPPPILTNHDRTPLPVRSPSSPVPFSHYAPNTTVKLQPVSTGPTKLEVQEPLHQQEPVEDDERRTIGLSVVVVDIPELMPPLFTRPPTFV